MNVHIHLLRTSFIRSLIIAGNKGKYLFKIFSKDIFIFYLTNKIQKIF